MLEKRCPKCNKLLAKVEESTFRIPKAIVHCITDTVEGNSIDEAKIHIKCPRCSDITILRV